MNLRKCTHFKKKQLHYIQLTILQEKYICVKRIFDIVIALVACIILSPLFVLTALAIKIEEPKGKVLFCQTRVGKDGKAFKIIKFRSMKSSTPSKRASCDLENPEQYITRLGKWIRRFSIDEMPQLWNVIKGDMSIVGPRPLLFEEKEIDSLRKEYGIYQIVPGITGLAQIRGRDEINYWEKFCYDWEYVNHLSFLQDCKLIIQTCSVVLSGFGYREGAQEKVRKQA